MYKGEALIEECDLDLFLDCGAKFKVLGIFPEQNLEQQKLSNLSQLCPGVFSEDATLCNDKNPETTKNNLDVEIKAEPTDAEDHDGVEENPNLGDPEIAANILEVKIKVEPTNPVRQGGIENNMPSEQPADDNAM